MPITRRAFSFVAFVGALSCGRPLYEQPGASWRLVSSPHFRMYTDTAASSYTRALDRLEEVYEALTASFFRGLEVPPVEVMMFNSEGDADDVIGRSGGVYAPAVGDHGLLAMRDAQGDSWALALAAHELAHRFIGARYPRLPVFLNEGLAAYFQTIQVVENEVLIGARPADLRETVEANQIIPLRELITDSWERFHGHFQHNHYASSWLFVHFAFHEGDGGADAENRLARMLAPFARRHGDADPARAILAAYPSATLDDVDERLRRYAAYVTAKRGNTVLAFPFDGHHEPQLVVAPADPAIVRAYARALRPGRLPLVQ